MLRTLTFLKCSGAAVCLTVLMSTGAFGQVVVNSRASEITLTGRVHAQFNTTSTSGELSSEWLIRRARFTADVKVNDFVSGRIQPDFGEGAIKLRDAYAQLTFSPSFRATIGQFKRPFDLFELTSSTQILVIERAGGVRGVSDCAGVGGVCSLSQLTEKLGFSDRDIGAMAEITTGAVNYQLALTNGAGANGADENGTKSYTGRVTIEASENLSIAGNVALHDYVDPVAADDDYAVAYGADLEYGNYDSGLHIQAGFVGGQNWESVDVSGSPANFLTAQGIITYKSPIANNSFVSAIEPVGRLSLADPDTDVGNNLGLLVTPGFVVHFVGRNKIAANIDVWLPDAGDTEWSFKMQTYFHF